MGHTNEELLAMLPTAMNFQSLRGLSLHDALLKAREVEAERAEIYRYWAQHRSKSETAFSAAREKLTKAELVIAVLQAGIAQEEAAQAPAKTAQRCPHYKAVKRAYAIARDFGLDTKADAAMRAAFSQVLGRRIASREELTGAEWMRVGDQIKHWGLTWEAA